MRRYFIVVALVGSHEDNNVRERGDLEQARDVTNRRPGRHIRTVPHHKVFEKIAARRIDGDAANLINVFVKAGGSRLRETLERAEETEMTGPGERAVDAGVSYGMARETGLWIGLRRDGPAEHVGDGALASAGAAEDGDVQRRDRLIVERRADAVAHQGGGKSQPHGRSGLIGLPSAMLFQPTEIAGELSG